MLIQQSLDKPLKQASYVVNDVNFLVDKCSYGCKAA